MFKASDGIGERGTRVPGPPWIVGHRGAPHECPENTLVGLQRALEHGLDGIEYDLRACASGEPVLIHDERLERTTDETGYVSERSLPELAAADAGGWFHKRFIGEPVPLLEEALELDEPPALEGEGSLSRAPLHVMDVKDPGLIPEIVTQLQRLPHPLSVRIASLQRSVCLEARDQGLAAMLVGLEATRDDLHFVRDERLAAFATSPDGWRTPAGHEVWPCETWAWPVDDPDELLRACRRPLFGLVTNEPRRALAVRALAFLTAEREDDDAGFPIRVPALEVQPPRNGDAARGEWAGRWETALDVRNPFPFPVELALALEVRGGAFEVEGLPLATKLAVGESRAFALRLAGGSWSPGEDPVVHARFVWRQGPGRPREALVLDAPLRRVRTVRLAEGAVRLPMLRERPGDREAAMTVRRRGNELLAWVEHAGGLDDVRAMMRVGERMRFGGQGVRLRLSELERSAPGTVAFSVGFDGLAGTGRGADRRLRRWAGGLPLEVRAGAPGRLILDRSA